MGEPREKLLLPGVEASMLPTGMRTMVRLTAGAQKGASMLVAGGREEMLRLAPGAVASSAEALSTERKAALLATEAALPLATLVAAPSSARALAPESALSGTEGELRLDSRAVPTARALAEEAAAAAEEAAAALPAALPASSPTAPA
jgi:hypothetical protein